MINVKRYLAYTGLCLVLFSGCRKHGVRQADGQLLTAARVFFEERYSRPAVILPDNPGSDRSLGRRVAEWEGAYAIEFQHRDAVVVPVKLKMPVFLRMSGPAPYFFNCDIWEKLLFYRDDSSHMHCELLTYVPDSDYVRRGGVGRFSGIVLIDDWWGNPIRKYLYKPDGTRYRYVPPPASGVTTLSTSTICIYLEGYNYSPSMPNEGVHWKELVGCYIMTDPDPGGGYGSGGYIGGPGGSGGGSSGGSGGSNVEQGDSVSSSKQRVTIRRPTRIISDLHNYFSCFAAIPGATYQIMVCVDQPRPGTRAPWVFDGYNAVSSVVPINVGHTFLVFTEQLPGGGVVSRSIGFYPSSITTPFHPAKEGLFNDDDDHSFNIGASYTLSPSLFLAAKAVAEGSQGISYQVNTYNCTNFVFSVLEAGHIYLPHTIGGWIGGSGLNPGDLGEDIRENNFTGMTRINDFIPHPNMGVCQ